MEHGAFKCPLSDHGLAELGRATYNWGMADMIAQTLLDQISGTRLKRELIMPLMIEKKAQILKKRLEDFPRGECRQLVKEFVTSIISINEGRNHAMHGFWGWEYVKGKEPRSAAHSYKSEQPLYADELTALADRIAVATRKAHRAMMILAGNSSPIVYPVNFWFGKGPPPEMQPEGSLATQPEQNPLAQSNSR
jgi:hypothetical protein